ncbi:MAG: TadE/TadG family type IV pilus assembly protein [Hyphomonadaceae bacterium]
MRVFQPVSWRRLRTASGGAAAVEFALIGPVLLALLMGILSYGGYFWIGHSVQQIANDAARATIAGLDDDEREMLAVQTLEREMAEHTALDIRRADVAVARAGGALIVSVSYNAEGSVFWAFEELLPMPSSLVERTATIQVGGF